MAPTETANDLNEIIRGCATALELNEAFERAIQPYRVTAYAVGYVPSAQAASADPFLLLTWPRAWLELYAREGFGQEDAVVAEASTTTEPFTWLELQAARPGASARIFEAARRFGWVDGFMIPIPPAQADGRRGVVSLAAAEPVPDSRTSRRRIVDLSKRVFAQAVLIAERQRTLALSPRELTVVTLVARGRTDREIARALSISVPTAHFHVEQVKRKLGAKTRAQAIAQAFARGLVTG